MPRGIGSWMRRENSGRLVGSSSVKNEEASLQVAEAPVGVDYFRGRVRVEAWADALGHSTTTPFRQVSPELDVARPGDDRVFGINRTENRLR